MDATLKETSPDVSAGTSPDVSVEDDVFYVKSETKKASPKREPRFGKTSYGAGNSSNVGIFRLGKIINFVIYFLIFTMPLFFLPFTFEFYNFNKTFLLFGGVTLLFILTIWRFFQKGEIKIVRTPVDLPVLSFTILALVSSLFAIDKTSAFLGFYGRFSGSFMEIFLLALFFWLIVQNWGARSDGINKTDRAVFLIFLSNLFIVLFTFFSLFDLGRFMEGSSITQFLRFSVFSPTGLTLQGLSVYFSASLIFLSIFLLVDTMSGSSKAVRFGGKRIFYYILFTLNFALLVLIDFWVSWVVLIVSLGVFLGFAFLKRVFQERSNLLVLPIFLILFSAIFLVFNVHNFLGISIDKEVLLPPNPSIEIISESFTYNPLLGSGPGNFWYDFGLYRGEEFLSSPFWQLRFSRSHFGFLEYLSGLGILGFLALLSVFGIFFLVSSYFLRTLSIKNSAPHLKFFLIFSGLVGWFLANILYASNVTFSFYLWLFLGLTVISWGDIRGGVLRVHKFSLKKIPEFSVVFLSLFIILIFVSLAFWWQGSRIYLADVAYKSSFDKNIKPEKRINQLTKAIRLAGNRGIYLIALSQNYLAGVVSEVNKPAKERDTQKIQNNVAFAIQAAKRATEVSPNSVSVWENLGGVYRDLGNIAENAIIWSENSFEKAIELEPANPFLYVSLAKAQMIIASSGKGIDEEKMNVAISNLEKARSLKEEYVGAYINKALILESQGNVEEAVKSLEDYSRDFISLGKGVWKDQSEVADFFFQLGRFYYNQNELNKAGQNFIQAINLVPLHSNARYSLAVIFESQGKRDEALAQYQIVYQLNPDNEVLKKKVEELQVPVLKDGVLEEE